MVDYITFCHSKDYKRLHSPGTLKKNIASHKWGFGKKILIHQRLRGIEPKPRDLSNEITNLLVLETEDYPQILSLYNIPENDEKADEYTHGPTAPHYWKWHVINHLIGLTVSQADYIVFSDADCYMKEQPVDTSWVGLGIALLKEKKDILIVSPSDGASMAEKTLDTTFGTVRLTQNVSQQMFLCERKRLAQIDFNIPWDWEKLAPGEPFQEYYYLLEGRIWRFMEKFGLYRAILPKNFRYWHNQW